jgi:hypothetical protein
VFSWGSVGGSGNGAKSWGQEIAGSRQFASCKVQQVFQTVCLRTPQTAQDQSVAGAATSAFQQNHDLKSVFQQVAAACAGS